MKTLWHDLRYGVRRLLKQPGFTAVAVLTLALGIGASTAIFSVVNGVLLRPLDYRESQQIMTLLNRGQHPVSPANFLDLRANNKSFSTVAAAEAWGGTLTQGDRPESLSGLRMGEGMFSLLGVSPLLGRTLEAEDFEPGKDHVLVLGHNLWQRSFGGDQKIIGQEVLLSGEKYTVVGVMPAQFRFPPFWSTRAEMWAPLDLRPRATNRGANSLRVFGRLKEGVTEQQAAAEVEAMSQQLASAYPEVNRGLQIRLTPLNEKVVGNVRPALVALSVTVGIVLLIACANVACLLLARAASRQKEAALRVALGASRWRIVRQLLTESLILSLCGAGIGVLLAIFGVDWLTTLLAGNSTSFSVKLPRLSEIKLDGVALLFTFAVSIVSSVLFGLAPALTASKTDLNELLKEGGRGNTGRGRLREGLVVAELALALMLLVGAGLLMKSFVKLQAVDPGFASGNLLTMTTSLAGASQYVGPTREQFYRQLTERLGALPGVSSVSAINHLPLAGDKWGRLLHVEGRPLSAQEHGIQATYRVSRPNYLRTMSIGLSAGRDFTDHDAPDAPGVILVNETFAKRTWPTEDPLGKRVTLDDPRDSSVPLHWLTVVGVVKDVKQDSWTDAAANEIYVPFQQSEGFFASTARQNTAMTMVVRTTVDARSLVNSVQDTVNHLDHTVAVSNVLTMDQVVADTLWQPRFNLQLIGLFAGLAIALAVIGMYGVMSYSVAQRTREVGVRMALGAQGRDVIKLVVRQGMWLAVIGVVVGIFGAFALTRLLTQLLFGVAATDALTFASVSAGLLCVALLACYIPARRATKVDPLEALRYE